MRRVLRKASPCLLLLTGIAGCAGGLEDSVRKEIRIHVSSSKAPDYARGAPWRLVRQVYRDHDDRPLWSKGGRPLGRARDLVASICDAGREGLRPADYDLEGLRDAARALRAQEQAGAEDIAAFDMRLTATMLAFGGDLLGGRLNPRTVDDGWYLRARRASVDSTLRAVFREEGFPDILDALRPRQKEYRELVEALEDYRELARKGGWPKVPPGKPLARGDRGERVAALRERLRATGELHASKNAEPVYDDKVAEAVARFQVRHGLQTDSSVGGATLSALNVPVERRIMQIEVNLDRYRWLPAEFEKRYLLVNIPDFHLYGYEGGREELEQRVIVGEEYQNATPVFADSMTHLVFRPEWNVPSSILVNEMLPKLREDIYDLARHGFEVVDTQTDTLVQDLSSIDWEEVDPGELPYRVRQRSGESNSLGLVKFMFPNRFNIYLHDTPSWTLFDQPVRTLSHGCVRVERPVELADFVLDGQDDWDERTIWEAMKDATATRGRTVSLERPVPVYILYLTTFMRDGELHFRNDPYGKDRRAMKSLGQPLLEKPAICEELERLLGG
jgi:murein L,D-transpeptidase YcbB/YkuD